MLTVLLQNGKTVGRTEVELPLTHTQKVASSTRSSVTDGESKKGPKELLRSPNFYVLQLLCPPYVFIGSQRRSRQEGRKGFLGRDERGFHYDY